MGTNRRNFLAAGATGTAGAVLATPNLASAQPRIRWRCPGSFPKSLDTLYGAQEFIARRVSEMTEGAFQIQMFAAGELVPALQVLDAAGAGTVECGYTSGYYYIGKDPSLALPCTIPFGLNTRQTWSWLNHGGGRQICAEVYRDQGVVGIPAGNTGAQMGGWFRKEIRNVGDLQGLKFRIAGYGGAVLQKLGVVAQQIGGPDIYPALERGVIDGAEWVGPYDDEKLGFNRVAQYYYYPGWWEYAPSIDMMVNAQAWDALPKQYQAIFEAACAEAWHWMPGRYDSLNPPALRRLIASGTQLRGFPRDVMLACYRSAQELYREIGDGNPRFKRIHAEWDKYRLDQEAWFRVAEDSLANLLAVATQQRG
ncbi:TRAP transporter substrate-binding protein DctP [Roseomonas sp. NAR14]|uniref:TRAP transporter substrate-binding protein DctP n=1 Tax=Roseomonas acroporae TaxID=2937791 RepID=A0A9X1Y7C8_9PROT|nr:TRAP transporter substrate-binding protein DctP [Roseomonas acroporae]MCK8783407.1 TRAP transporter substrate-binding protein DctP [Roseomonas acroporae]